MATTDASSLFPEAIFRAVSYRSSSGGRGVSLSILDTLRRVAPPAFSGLRSRSYEGPGAILKTSPLGRIQHLALHHLAPSAALTLHDVPVTMLLSVFDSPIAAQYILAFDCTQKLALEKILGLHYSHFEKVTP